MQTLTTLQKIRVGRQNKVDKGGRGQGLGGDLEVGRISVAGIEVLLEVDGDSKEILNKGCYGN